jgi:hypothetical protein
LSTNQEAIIERLEREMDDYSGGERRSSQPTHNRFLDLEDLEALVLGGGGN